MHSRYNAGIARVIILIHNNAAAFSRATNEAYIVVSHVSLKFFGVDSVKPFGIATRIWCAILINGSNGGDSSHPEITRRKWSPMHRSLNNLLRSKKMFVKTMRFCAVAQVYFFLCKNYQLIFSKNVRWFVIK